LEKYRAALALVDLKVSPPGVALGLVWTAPCGVVPQLEDGQAHLQLAEPVLLARRAADPKLEAVPALPLVELVVVELRTVSPV